MQRGLDTVVKKYRRKIFVEVAPGGCVAGAGTNIPIPKAQKKIKDFVKASTKSLPEKDLFEIKLP